MNVNKPNYTRDLEKNSISTCPLRKSSEYVPLFTVLNGCNNSGIFWASDWRFNAKTYEHITEDYNASIFKKINIKYNGKSLNQFQYTAFKGLNSNRNLPLPRLKTCLADYKANVERWIFNTELDYSIPNYWNTDSNYWDNIVTCFREGGYNYIRRYMFVDTYFEANYGWIAESDSRKVRKPLICLMMRKENIPFVKANLLMDIPIPDGVVEGWVLDELDSPAYPKQSLRKSFKEKIFPEITAQGIPIIKKTRAELDGIYFQFKEPAFKTVAARNNWLEELTKKFIASEKLRLGIVDKSKFSFNSVKTYIAPITIEEDGLSATIGVDPASNEVTLAGNNEETREVLRSGLRNQINSGSNAYYSYLNNVTLQDFEAMVRTLDNSRNNNTNWNF